MPLAMFRRIVTSLPLGRFSTCRQRVGRGSHQLAEAAVSAGRDRWKRPLEETLEERQPSVGRGIHQINAALLWECGVHWGAGAATRLRAAIWRFRIPPSSRCGQRHARCVAHPVNYELVVGTHTRQAAQ